MRSKRYILRNPRIRANAILVAAAMLSGCATCPKGYNAYWNTCLRAYPSTSRYYSGTISDETDIQIQSEWLKGVGESPPKIP